MNVEKKKQFLYSLLLISCFTAFVALYWIIFAYARDFHQHYFRGEDKLVEWITFAGFLGASLVLSRVLRYRKAMDKLTFLYLLGLSLFFFVCAGEELSWGQRIFGFKTPTEIVAQNEQAEFNLHNMKFKYLHPIFFVS